ncbi:MAG: tetratricopeptide repeat protein [Gammaproteobacteria bacterium]|jgi:TolB-like protein/tetratricopeptide (TPR) repeat protein
MSGDARRPGGLLSELRRRNVFRVATVYLIASWLLIQVAETVFPALQLPEWTVTFVVVVLAILFPIAVIFAWAFELTPEGLKKTTEVEPKSSITSRTGQKINYLIIGILAVAILFLALTHGGLKDDGVSAERSATGTSAAQSIAVLPFVNMSDDEDNEFFSDGLSEELLNVLAQVEGLRVAARTSSFYFKDSNEDVRSIASKLGVDHLLEGSVRRSGDRIRVTAQLIKADDGFHLWSDTYDYTVDDVFRIQDEISLAVVDALKVNLLGKERERLTKRATTDVEAHNLYLRGRQFLHLRTLESIRQARKLFQQAVRMDPGYALAYSGLSDSIQLLATNHSMITAAQAEAESRPLLDRAIALDPEAAEVWASVGLMEMIANNPEAAEPALEKAVRLNPSYAAGYLWLASVRSGPPINDDEGALELYRKVLEIDPLSRVAQNNIAAILMDQGRTEEAEAEFRRALTLDPDYTGSYNGLANLNQNFYFRLDEAHRWFMKAHELAPSDISISVNLPVIYRTLGLDDQFDRWSRRLQNEGPDHPIGSVIPVWREILAGRFDAALDAWAKAEQRVGGTGGVASGLAQMRCDALRFSDRASEALSFLTRDFPELMDSPPRVDVTNNNLVACAAAALKATGRADQLEELLEAARRYAESNIPSVPNREMYLARIDIAGGREASAIRYLQSAVEAGWVGGFNWAWSIDEDPDWAPVKEHDDVANARVLIAERLAIQRAAVEQQLQELGAGALF